MTRMIENIRPLTDEEIDQVSMGLRGEVELWARSQPSIRTNEGTKALVADIAAVHAADKASLALSRAAEFQRLINAGVAMHDGSQDPMFNSPAELAGKAAGQLSIVILLAEEHRLSVEDIAMQQEHAIDIAAPHNQMQAALSYRPKDPLGIREFDGSELYIEERTRVENLMRSAGVAGFGETSQSPLMDASIFAQ